MEPIALNMFQRIMRLWDRVHPYNAAQVLRICGQADVDRMGAAWLDTLRTLGVGAVRLEGDCYRHESVAGEGAEMPEVVAAGTSMQDFVSREMNRAFVAQPAEGQSYCPFRAFVIEDDGAYYAGVVYHHWVADSVSIRMLLREWLYRLFEPRRARREPLRLARQGLWHYFGPAAGGWNLADGVLATLRSTTRFCGARRLELNGADYRVRCMVRPLPEGLIDQLHEAARGQQATLHDLFMAAAGMVCQGDGLMRMAPFQQELALGTVVDLRPGGNEDLSDVFGLFLGFTTVLVRPQIMGDWFKLVQTIARQNAWHKQAKGAQVSQLRMAAAVAESRLLPLDRWVHFYQRHMPVAAGVSNVNMGRTWAAEYHPEPLLDYFRFSPTGPAMPLLFTVSSLGQRSHLALTYRTSLIAEQRAGDMAQAFVRTLETAAQTGSSAPRALHA